MVRRLAKKLRESLWSRRLHSHSCYRWDCLVVIEKLIEWSEESVMRRLVMHRCHHAATSLLFDSPNANKSIDWQSWRVSDQAGNKMTPTGGQKSGAKCSKSPGQVICGGCEQWFCVKHLLELEHRPVGIQVHRENLRNSPHQVKKSVRGSLHQITTVLQKSWQMETFIEIELNKWRNRLQELRAQLEKLSTIAMVDERFFIAVPPIRFRMFQRMKGN